MANAAGFNESVVFARTYDYAYRKGLGMISSAEHVVFFDDFNRVVTSNVPSGWSAAIIDTGATVASLTTCGLGRCQHLST
jgi:hypothetical protein